VITPRICGICSTSQLYAATSALEVAFQSPLAPNGTRIRNLCLMAEAVMSDARHTFLMFAPDLCNEAYRGQPLYDEALALFEPPFKGRVARETVQNSKQILGIVIAFGGQWPHATYMAPGGVTCELTSETLAACLTAIDDYTEWYEQVVLGCSSERWLALRTIDEFFAWLDEDEARQRSAVASSRASAARSACIRLAWARRICSAPAVTTIPNNGARHSQSAIACYPPVSTTG